MDRKGIAERLREHGYRVSFEAAQEIETLRAALSDLLEYAWYSDGKGNFKATVTQASLDKARNALRS